MGRSTSPIMLDFGDDYTPPEGVPVIRRRVGRKRLAFGWYGGKFSHLDWLLPLLPECHHYCEPFAGSAAVLLNRQPSPVETYNDLDGEVANFFRVLRDSFDELHRALSLTPFSREEYFNAIYGVIGDDDQVERARRFFIRARQTRFALAQTASLGRWANNSQTSRNNMAGGVSRWLGGVEGLTDVAARLLQVQIENRPAVDIINTYDHRDTLFYCDPPYLHDTRGDVGVYAHEMTDDDHRELADACNRCVGKVAVSGYDHPLMDELYPSGRWHKAVGEERTIHTTKQARTEVLWTNYPVDTQRLL